MLLLDECPGHGQVAAVEAGGDGPVQALVRVIQARAERGQLEGGELGDERGAERAGEQARRYGADRRGDCHDPQDGCRDPQQQYPMLHC
jgi:hypothetical protein